MTVVACDEARRLLDRLVSRPFDYTFCALLLATGLRLSEATVLTVGDLDRGAGLCMRWRSHGRPRGIPALRVAIHEADHRDTPLRSYRLMEFTPVQLVALDNDWLKR